MEDTYFEEGLLNTEILKINLNEIKNVNIYAKLEMNNPTGSVKDRAAIYVIEKLLNTKQINKDTVIIESSSGNFGVALSTYCKHKGLPFYCIIDENTTSYNEKKIKDLSTKVFKIDEPDNSGGYLLNRIEKAKELKEKISNSYWINQYENVLNAEAYYNTLGREINDHFDSLDFAFVGVSSGGTITGLSNRLKEKFPNIMVIAVDIAGSTIFGNKPKKRFIPGIGSSKYPKILDLAKIDKIAIVEEIATINMCHRLNEEYKIFAGGSSGSVMAAILDYFKENSLYESLNVITIFPDGGKSYFDTVYNTEWCKEREKDFLENSNK